MGLAGQVGAGAQDALQELVAQRLLEEQQAARLRQQEFENALRVEEFDARRTAEAKAADDRARMIRSQDNEVGLKEMELQRGAMDRDQRGAALDKLSTDASVPEAARVLIPLLRAGAINQLPTSSLEPKEDPRQKLALELERYEGQKRLDAKYRPASTGSSAPPEQVWVMRNGQVTPIRKGGAQPGDVPYDPVAARQQNPASTLKDEPLRTAQEVVRVAKTLREHPSRGSVFGAFEGMLPSVKQGSVDAQTLVDQLNGLLALDNMGKMKGVLSDKDMQIIRQASTRLSNQRISDEAAYQELSSIIDTVESRLGRQGMTPEAPDDGDPLAELERRRRARGGG